MKEYTIDLEPVGLRIITNEEMTILDAAQRAGVEIAALCGGDGWCGKCRVQLMQGNLSPMSEVEQDILSEADKSSGIRLACQTRATSNVKLNIPPEALTTAQRLQTEGTEEPFDLDPMIHSFKINLQPPTVHDLRSDMLRVQDALEVHGIRHATISFPLLQTLSNTLRALHWQAQVVVRNCTEVIAVLPQDLPIFGLAVDIGTTKMAGYLVDLKNGLTVSKAGFGNPQVPYGEDVVSRIAYANQHPDGAKLLQQRLVDRLNEMIHELCRYANAQPEQIVDSVFVGNTAIHHLFLGIPVSQLGTAPYIASVSDAVERRAVEIGLAISPAAYLYMPPNIAGFVGADHVSMLLATNTVIKSRMRGETIVSLDIGTNTEISLAHDGRLLSCSCASGPAFEGAHITNGMRAMPGAIEKVRIDEGTAFYQTIEKAAPIGICGSGILDAVAELNKHHMIDPNGQLRPDAPGVESEGRRSRKYILVPAEKSGTGGEIVVSRKDINEIQLAKGAIRAGVEVLLLEAGISSDEIDQFIIAGAFGTYLDLENAVSIGMFPVLPKDRYQQVGNAAGIGAKHLLLSREKRAHVDELIRGDEYIELTAHPEFTRIYVDALQF
ncbi:MAG: DUF4445 domain-containing protein [Anaerolineae bacterium]|nr:DUF4445 domain-containing protein [Anaerolineae bacterium]